MGAKPFLLWLLSLSLSFWWDWVLNLGLYACKTGALLLEPNCQSILFWLFWKWSPVNYLPGLALNLNPPNLSLPSSHRHEPWVPGFL
jgi:hypothetical protein